MVVKDKIIFAGIQNAGKTSILHTLDKEFEKIEEIAPTKGVEYSQFEVLGTILARWDMGGQDIYRKRYLEDIARYFLDTGLLIFVIDLQEEDPTLQANSITYLRSLLGAFKALEVKPVVAVFLHKNDPDVLIEESKKAKIRKHMAVYIDAIQQLREEEPFEIWYYPTTIKDPVDLVKTFSHALLQFLDQRILIKEKLWDAAGHFGAMVVYLVEKTGLLLGTSDPEGVPEDLRRGVEKTMYDMIPSLSVPMSPQCHALPTQEEMLVCQFQVNEDPFYLVTVWPEGQGKAQLAACEAGDFLESYLDELARLIKLFYPKNVD